MDAGPSREKDAVRASEKANEGENSNKNICECRNSSESGTAQVSNRISTANPAKSLANTPWFPLLTNTSEIPSKTNDA